ncbi:MAG: NPCBM/NEW2 domain-containing protein [Planctomycetes bacterium]|nr:NPCBM/NEW2 domain-containing protein [Planctomycetota bacterium]
MLSVCLPGATLLADAPGPTVRVQTVGPKPIEGTLVELSPTGGLKIRLDSAPLRVVPTEDVVRIVTSATPTSSGEALDRITFSSATRLGGRFISGENSHIIFDAEDIGIIRVPIDSMIRWRTARFVTDRFGPPAPPDDSAPPDDRLLLTNGDVIRGFISTIDDRGISVAGDSQEYEIPHDLLAGVRFARASAPPPKGRHALVDLRHGGRITVTGLEWRGGSFVAELPDVGRVTIEAGDVLSIEMIGGRWEWLSLREPVTYQHTPMLSLDWPYRTDENLFGGPLAVAGRRFERGISVHSRSSLTYELGGRYREFVTALGLDDTSGPLADVDVLVRVDGKTLYSKQHLRRGELVGPIRLEIRGASRIELIVDFGAGGDLQDRFDWIEPALIR